MRAWATHILCESLALAGEGGVGDASKIIDLSINPIKQPDCPGVRLCGQFARAVHAVQAHVGDLAEALVGADRLSKLLLRPGDVEDVVHDLKEQTQFTGEGTVCRVLCC